MVSGSFLYRFNPNIWAGLGAGYTPSGGATPA
jgi:hypothetical protein